MPVAPTTSVWFRAHMSRCKLRTPRLIYVTVNMWPHVQNSVIQKTTSECQETGKQVSMTMKANQEAYARLIAFFGPRWGLDLWEQYNQNPQLQLLLQAYPDYLSLLKPKKSTQKTLDFAERQPYNPLSLCGFSVSINVTTNIGSKARVFCHQAG